MPNCLPKWLYHFISPPATDESSCCSTSSPAFGVVSILDFGLCNRHVVVSRLHFPNDIQCRAPFHILICHLYIFFGEMSVHAFCPVFKSGFSFSCCWVLRGLCIFWIRVFYQDMVLQIFSSSLRLVFLSSWPLLFVNKILFEYSTYSFIWASQVAQLVKNPPANAGNTGSVPGLERSPGEGNSNPLQYSCLGNPMDRGAWRATVCGVAKELDMT